MEQKIRNLIDFCQGIYHKENGKELYQKYLQDIQRITPQEVMLVQYEQLKLGLSPKEMLSFVDKLMNVFFKPLSSYEWKKPEEGTFLYYLMEENRELTKRLDAFKAVIKGGDLKSHRDEVRSFVEELTGYDGHLLRLENILFPTLQKKRERFTGLKIMWSLHDEVREQWKAMNRLMEDAASEAQELSREIGLLYFQMYGLVQKQELILFPAASELLTREDFEDMHRQSFEYSFSFIERPEMPEGPETPEPGTRLPADNVFRQFITDTGRMDLEQLELLLNVLPVDLTLVDEQDKVAYFSKPKDRVFPRSAAVIGLDVRNCHPPESVHVVEAILDSFKKGEKDSAEFWIQMKGKFLSIQYLALRDRNGTYRGTLEVTQEISGLRALQGERRLLEW